MHEDINNADVIICIMQTGKLALMAYWCKQFSVTRQLTQHVILLDNSV